MADFNYEEEVKKRMRKLERLHQAFEAQDLDSGGLQDLKKEGFECCKRGYCAKSDFTRYLKARFGEMATLYFGTDPEKIDVVLDALWDTPYYDWDSEQEYTFCTWARIFSEEESAQLYGNLVNLKNTWKNMYYETVEKYNKLKNKGANNKLKEKLEMLNQSISDVLDNWDEEDDRHKDMPPMCIDDEMDLDGNIKPGKPGMIIE
ncbi:MAG: hypothetical protein J5711_05845 [Bacteroidales bacterium]|nr:hypothetical protein [Bacteroidales bacterium]